jgi:arylsulfatase B
MLRRRFLQSSLSPLLAAAKTPPNVVLVMTDDQGYGDLGCHGNPVLRTPNLDALHARSIRLENYHVSPTCAPTRSALMTGRYTNITGAWHTIQGRSLLDPREVTMADCFRASGYRTGIFGKWHLGDNLPCRPQDRGFDEVLIHGGGGIWQTPDHFGNDYDGDTYRHNGKLEKYEGFCTDVWFENAMKFMAESRSPFFCYVATNAPHSPMWAPARYEERYRNVKGLNEPGFYGMIENIDENMGRLATFLRGRNLAENTIVIFTTDNGTASGAQVHSAGMRASKGSAYEGGHRVPFFIHWPAGGLTGGKTIRRLAAHIDILPTLIELCGLKRPKGPEIHGKSLRPLLEDPEAAWPDRALVVDSQRLDRLVKWRQAAVMTDRWRLVNPSPDGNPVRLELYDMSVDPQQSRDISKQHLDVVTHLSAEYERWWAKVSVRAGEYVRIRLGDARESPSRLTCHDWHGDGVEKVWNQAGIRSAPAVEGFWAVEVSAGGVYQFELRRWPEEVDLAINAPYRDNVFNRERASGVAISAVRAGVKIGRMEQVVPVREGDKAAVLRMRLSKGPFELRAWFEDREGTRRGAYFAYITKIS